MIELNSFEILVYIAMSVTALSPLLLVVFLLIDWKKDQLW